jgi:hypothetical protein
LLGKSICKWWFISEIVHKWRFIAGIFIYQMVHIASLYKAGKKHEVMLQERSRLKRSNRVDD